MLSKPEKTRRPFHKAIVEVICRANTVSEMGLLLELLLTTIIPKGHDEIIKAWEEQATRLGMGDSIPLGWAKADLLEQKNEAEAAIRLEEED